MVAGTRATVNANRHGESVSGLDASGFVGGGGAALGIGRVRYRFHMFGALTSIGAFVAGRRGVTCYQFWIAIGQ